MFACLGIAKFSEISDVSENNVNPVSQEVMSLEDNDLCFFSYSNFTIKYGGKNSYFWVVANNKTIHSITWKHCYFYQLNFLKNLCYRYYILSFYSMYTLNPKWYGRGWNPPLCQNNWHQGAETF